MIPTPYLLFLGDAADALPQSSSRHQTGRPELCVGQIKLDGCNADMGLENLTIEEAVQRGAKTMVIGVANRGGYISDSWRVVIKQALEAGMDVASGLHNLLRV